MSRTVVKRLLEAIPLLLLITLMCYALLERLPGGPLAMVGANPHLTAVERARLMHALGLDLPWPVRYVQWLGGVLHGDLGRSLFTGRPVGTMLLERLGPTLLLMGLALAVSLALGVALGVWGGLRPRSRSEAAIGVASVILYATPTFWLGLVLLWAFAARLRWFPSGGMAPLGVPWTPATGGPYLVLPVLMLAVGMVASWSRYVRGSVLEVMAQDFVRVARAKGLSEVRIVWRHVLRNALIPLVTVVMMALPSLAGGAVVTETLFSWPGLGRLFYDALTRRDYPVLMGVLLMSAVLVVACNLVADLLYRRLDPRIRLE
ncbi:MAG: ABC transporter permease [bacterium]|nr:ABC transporter permease [bacterium]